PLRFRILGSAVALLVAATAVLATSATGGARDRFGGAPDAFVASWDAVGSQAFTAAALSPPEGHTIFAYVGIAVYDSVVAVEGGWEPFAIDLDAPAGASPEAAVAAAAHHSRPLPAGTGGGDHRSRVRGFARDDPGRPAED